MTGKTMLEALGEVVRLYDDERDTDAAEDALMLVLCHTDEIRHNALRLRALEMAMDELAELESSVHFSKFTRSDLEMLADEIMQLEMGVAG